MTTQRKVETATKIEGESDGEEDKQTHTPAAPRPPRAYVDKRPYGFLTGARLEHETANEDVARFEPNLASLGFLSGKGNDSTNVSMHNSTEWVTQGFSVLP